MYKKNTLSQNILLNFRQKMPKPKESRFRGSYYLKNSLTLIGDNCFILALV